MPTYGVVAATVAVKTCYPTGLIALRLPLPRFLPVFPFLLLALFLFHFSIPLP